MMRITLLLLLFAGFFVACDSGEPKQEDNTEDTADAANPQDEENKAEKVAEDGPDSYEIGDVVEDFSLKNIDGEMVSMSDYPEAKGYVVIFTCNHCPFSIAYEDRIIEFDKKYKEKGYPVIAINPNDPAIAEADGFEEMKVRAEEKGFTFPYLFDETQEVFPKFGASKTPHCYIVQKSEAGMKLAYIGAFDDSKEEGGVEKHFLSNAVDALLEGNSPEPAYTKAFGCSIKCEDKSKLKKL